MRETKSFPCIIFEKYPENTVFFAVETKNVTGIMAKISSILGRANMSILNGFHGLYDGGERWHWVFAVDPSEASVSVEEVAEEIKALEDVLNVSYGVRRVAGMVLPPFAIDLRMRRLKAYVFDENAISMFLKSLWERWGSAGAVFLYHTGRWAGRTMASAWAVRFGVTELKDLLSLMAAMYQLSGLVRDYEMSVGVNEAIVRLYEYFECSCLRGADKPSGYLMRGILTGMFEECMGVEASVIEERCVAAGDPYCEFRVKFSVE